MPITKRQLLEHVTTQQIYRHYCPKFNEALLEGNRNIKSVFNPSETNPSLSFYRSGNQILYKCHSTGYQGDCFQFVADLYGLNNKREFQKVLDKVSDDLRVNYVKRAKRTSDWKGIYYDGYTKKALAYWESFGVDVATLMRYKVKQLKKLSFKSNSYDYEKKNIIAFEFDVNGRYKLYVPSQENVDQKYYIKTQNSGDIFGLDQLSSWKTTYTLICEGEKDTLVAAAAGIPAICFQSANTTPSKSQIRELLKHSAYLILCYDNDSGGQKGAKKLVELYDLINYQLDPKYNDLAEYLPNADNKDFRNLLFQSITDWRTANNVSVWEQNNCYWKSDRQSKPVQVSNFIVELDAMIMGSDTPQRLIRLVGPQHITKTLRAPIKIFSSEQNFSLFAESQKGNFLFHGTKNDLQEIKRKVFHLSDYLDEANAFGWHKKREIFILSNGVISDGQFFRPNHMGIWEDLYIPTAAENYEIRTGDNSNYEYKSGRDLSGDKIQLDDYINSVVDSFGDHVAITSIAYIISSTLFDFISGKFRAFPMLNVEGQRGTGKGSLIKMLMTLFTAEVQEISLQNATKNFMTRKMAQLPNIPVWLDEFSNGLHESIIQTLKNFYDLIGRSKAQYTAGNETTRSQILSPAIITGEEAPKHNEALFSRLIVLSLPPLEKSIESTTKFMRRMMSLQNGISHVLAEIIGFRDLIIQNYEESYNELLEYFYTGLVELNLTADTRIIKNYASIFAPLLVLANQKKVSFESENIKVRSLMVMADHQRSQVKYDEVNIFLDHMMSMNELSQSNASCIVDGYDYLIQDDVFYLKKNVFSKWGKYYRDMTGRIGKDPTAIETYIKHKKYFLKETKKYFKLQHKTQKSQSRCLSFDLRLMPDFFKSYFINTQNSI